ncbi:MAG: bi-domain-containing oxidoreductase [Opitutaceae bacterium]|nr:bi-domain-containing oxidoreductase [Opitutaceae bacterium]
MKQVLIVRGKVVVEQVPEPQVMPNNVLVQVKYSCISTGTELNSVKAGGVPLWQQAIRQPQNVKKIFHQISSNGLGRTYSKISGNLASGSPAGYSAAGVVIEVGDGIKGIQIGDRVACAGAQCAYHAEIICVPKNLVVRIPVKLDDKVASTVTLGSIALQGVRRAQPTIGEVFVVIGLGVLGQLVTQLLKANGCRVIGMDLDQERIDLAVSLGMDKGLCPHVGDNYERVSKLTDGYGVDGVIVTAATSSSEVISTAFNMCRKKGRVVLVGDVGLNINRSDIYQKEIDFFISTSYGPGRYDRDYEEYGLDYPIAYVRWTENRNMGEYLRLIADSKLNVKSLITKTYPIEQAHEAYADLKGASFNPLLVLLSYSQKLQRNKCVLNPRTIGTTKNKIRLAIIGAGEFAKGMHLPNIKTLSNDFHIQSIVSRSGSNAKAVMDQFKANYATTDYFQVLNDKDVEAVLISTRHTLHAKMVLQALKAGKHVLVEKPLAINSVELNEIVKFYNNSGAGLPLLLTGFNRRFSPYAIRIKEVVEGRTNPMIINYRMNAGYIPLDHWVHGSEGAGRNIGEACHIYDLFTYLTNSRVIKVSAHSINPKGSYYSSTDNFVATMSFDDGSIATLTYTALGNKAHPKEQLEIYVDGHVLSMTDYQQLDMVGIDTKGLKSRKQEKGQFEELKEFSSGIKKGEWPIPLWQQIQAMEMAFVVDKEING